MKKFFILFLTLAVVIPSVAMAAHSGDGASTITTGWSNGQSSDYYIEWTWTGDGTTLSTTIDMGSIMPDRSTWYLYMVREVHGTGAADPSDHAVTITNSVGVVILVTDNFTASGFANAAQDMPNYWTWDGGSITVSTTDIGNGDTAAVRLIFLK